MLTLDDCPQIVPGVIARMTEGLDASQTEAVLVLPEKGQVKVINEVGARIWQLVNGERNVRQIAEVIRGEYQVDQSQAESDALAFITELLDREIVTLHKK